MILRRLPAILVLSALFTMTLGTLRAQSQSEMNADAEDKADKADKELTAVYQQLLDSMKDDADAQKSLEDAEKAWLDYRDKEAAFEASSNLGGSIYPMVVSGVAKRLTEERIAYLKHVLKDGLD